MLHKANEYRHEHAKLSEDEIFDAFCTERIYNPLEYGLRSYAAGSKLDWDVKYRRKNFCKK